MYKFLSSLRFTNYVSNIYKTSVAIAATKTVLAVVS